MPEESSRPAWMEPPQYNDDADAGEPAEGESKRTINGVPAPDRRVPDHFKADPALRDPNVVDIEPTKTDVFGFDEDDE